MLSTQLLGGFESQAEEDVALGLEDPGLGDGEWSGWSVLVFMARALRMLTSGERRWW
jgi:hypothetical protein